MAGLAAPVQAGQAETPAFIFGVISPRSAVITAQYWNPILRYLTRQSGVPLKLKVAKSSPELAAMIQHGELHFIYSNYQFAPGNDGAGYIVIARPLASPSRGQIVVSTNSPYTSLEQLQGREVAFPSKVAFTGFQVPMDALLRAGIHVKPRFAGTIEGALGQMLSGRAAAAGVSAVIANAYAERQNVSYRVLWSSEEYPTVPIAVHPAVPKEKVDAVRTALLSMSERFEGREILTASSPLFGQPTSFGFVAASNAEYEHMHRFYRQRLPLPEGQ
ncbi:phosphate/phosphite/phosphonate ABC transporter substrate-binding protein [Paucimonas lemoignei]|nr:phosphate/phosphite/phosphonate ABC transporter substrate-binding protein [Paucimonas lemoignei]